MNAENVIDRLTQSADPMRAISSARFFKTGTGEYGEGDVFLGLSVPLQRIIAKEFAQLPLSEAIKLLRQKEHECRLTALIILVNQYKKGSVVERQEIYGAYLANTKHINNWDLVDTSAAEIVGRHLGSDTAPLIKLAHSNDLWEKRIAMIACYWSICKGNPEQAFTIIELLKNEKHDLLQKAVGWMLREIGKRCSMSLLEAWLQDNYKTMPRTSLRYAIEHFSPAVRKTYLLGLKG